MTNKRLDFDLDFLDEKTKKHDSANREKNSKQEIKKSYKENSKGTNWKGILLVIGIPLVLLFLAYGSDSSSSNHVTDESVAVGDYLCSSANASYADSISPDLATLEELNAEQSNLEYDYSQLDEYDHFAVDEYNARVDEYNTKKDEYNYSVDQYNTYLLENCTKNN